MRDDGFVERRANTAGCLQALFAALPVQPDEEMRVDLPEGERTSGEAVVALKERFRRLRLRR